MEVMTVLWSVITIMVGIIGYFIVRNFNQQDKTNEALRKSVDKLADSITGLSAIVLKYEERHDQLRKEYDKHLEDLHK